MARPRRLLGQRELSLHACICKWRKFDGGVLHAPFPLPSALVLVLSTIKGIVLLNYINVDMI